MAEDRTVYKFEGDATGLIRSLQGVSRALDMTAKKADKTDTELKQLQAQSGKSAMVSKRLSSAMGRLGDSLKKTGKNAGKFASDLNKKVIASVKKANISFGKLAKGSGALATALLGAGAAAGAFFQHMADGQNELSDLSSKTGVATKTLAGLRLAAKGSGQELGDLASALEPMIERMGQVAAGSQGAKDAFKAVGVDVLDAEGKLRSADEVILEITENLNDMTDPTERAAAAALAFGGAGTKLVQALGGQDLAVFSDAAARFGMDTGPRAAKAADDWQRAMANLDLIMRPFTTDVLEWATRQVNAFGLGWVYISTLLQELSKNILPNLKNAFLLIFADISLKILDLNESVMSIIMNALEGYGKAYAFFTGDTGPIEKVKELRKAQDETRESMREFFNETKVGIATTSTLADAYKKAFDEAKAFYDLQNVETTKPSGGFVLPTKEEEKKPEKAKEKEEEKDDKKEELSTLMKMADVTKTLGENMSDLADPAGVFRDIMGEVTDALVSIDEIDFEEPTANLEKFGIIARGMGDIFGSVIKGIMKSNDDLTKKQRTTLLVLFALQKAAGITSIIIDTAIAAQKALAVLGPIAGPIAAGLITVQGAVQAGVVASQKPPFHVGGIIPAADQMSVPINALPGEAVLNREATAGLGAEGVAALNSGQGMNQPVVVEMVYKHRIFDNFVQDNISKGGPLRSAIKSGRRVGHRSRG